jgi:protein phosphatase
LTRAINEDSILVDLPVFVVADGMGGHHAGDVASRIVVDEFARSSHGGTLALDEVLATIQRADAAVVQEGSGSSERVGMGTTAVGLVLVDNGPSTSWLLFNVGDSRAYRLHDGRLDLLSVDHSYVQELVAAGEITEQDAREHPNRNVVTRALGVGDGPHPDYWFIDPLVGERYLLCSDGLTTEVDDAGIRDVLANEPDPADAARTLIDRALSAGGHDNISVVVVDVLAIDDPVASEGESTAPRGVHVVSVGAGSPLDAVGTPNPATSAEPPSPAQPEIDGVPGAPTAAADSDSDADPPGAATLIEGVPDFIAPAEDEADDARDAEEDHDDG